jgi:predicted SAM-dependent methyltransferase
MGKGAPLRWIENRCLAHYLHGQGIEIGALSRPFPVPRRARVWYVDRYDRDELAKLYPVKGDIGCPDVLADANELPFAPSALDFLIASHVFEHLPFPLLALRTWYDLLAPAGVLLLKIPDKRYTFDSKRSRTPLAHLLEEYEHPDSFDWRSHYADWLENVDGRDLAETKVNDMVANLKAGKQNIHYHTWVDDDLREIIDFTCQVWRLDWKPVVFLNAHFYRKEIVLLLVRNGR